MLGNIQWNDLGIKSGFIERNLWIRLKWRHTCKWRCSRYVHTGCVHHNGCPNVVHRPYTTSCSTGFHCPCPLQKFLTNGKKRNYFEVKRQRKNSPRIGRSKYKKLTWNKRWVVQIVVRATCHRALDKVGGFIHILFWYKIKIYAKNITFNIKILDW